jgi:hypothetical protein
VGKRRGLYRVLVGKPGGNRQLGRPRRRWEDDIKIDLQELECGVYIGLSWLRMGQVAGTCECGNELWGSIKCREFHD